MQSNEKIKVDRYSDALIATFPAGTVQVALRKIGSERKGEQLLAIARYLRKGTAFVAANWVWSDEQIAAYKSTPRAAEVHVAVEAVDREFRALAEGFHLSVKGPRGLDEQVSKWVSNLKVRERARLILSHCASRIAQLPDSPDAASIGAFRRHIGEFDVTGLPLAAPGLSDHGQMQAVDFQVVRTSDGKVVATPEIRAIPLQWEKSGYTELLIKAVKQAGNRFVGPLRPPAQYEPWHYFLP